MKKTILFLTLAFAAGNFATSCSSRDEDPVTQPEKQDFTNANYIKAQMQGTWKYWGHKSPSCDCWVYSGDVYNSYYTFNSDNTYQYKSLFDVNVIPMETGTYTITPVIGSVNATLNLSYIEKGVQRQKMIILKGLEGNTVTIYTSSWDERFVKQ